MSKVRFTLQALGLVILSLAFTSLAQAQATRTWVSGVGDDVNPCSRTAPCKTYAGAISKTAKDGEISTLDPGGFGAVTITKSITINGGGGGAGYGSILASGTNGVIVNITDPADVRKTVRLDWLNINGASTGLDGVRFLAGLNLFVENCTIDGFTSDGIEAALNGTTGRLYVNNTSIRNCVGNGIRITQSSAGNFIIATVENSRIYRNGNGFNSADRSRAAIRNTDITLNTATGVLASTATGDVQIEMESCGVNYNLTGIQASNGTIRISNNYVMGNTTGLSPAGGQIKSWGNNRVAGNVTDGAPTAPNLTQL